MNDSNAAWEQYSKTDRVILVLRANKLPMYASAVARVASMVGDGAVFSSLHSLVKQKFVTKEEDENIRLFSMSDEQFAAMLKQRGLPRILTADETVEWRKHQAKVEVEQKKADRQAKRDAKLKAKERAREAKVLERANRLTHKRIEAELHKSENKRTRSRERQKARLQQQYQDILVEMGKLGIRPTSTEGAYVPPPVSPMPARVVQQSMKVADDDEEPEAPPMWRLRLDGKDRFSFVEKLNFLNRIKASPAIFASSPILADIITDYSPASGK